VAVLADIRCTYMRGVLASGVDAIVATEAIARDVRVVKNSRYPERARVAIVAVVAGENMAGRFAGRLHSVVASTTATEHSGVIHVRDGEPGRCRMACFACLCRCNMAGRLHCRENCTDLGVTACASRTRPLENSTGVAAVAVDILVCAIKVETRAEVIKLLLRMRGRREQQHAEHDGNECLHWIRCTSSKESLEWHRPQSKPNSPL